jgi:hypothetical protein
MNPQHFSLLGRAFPWGMTAQAYLRIECYRSHFNAVYKKILNATNSGFRYRYSPANRLVRYCFHCFHKWLIYLWHHLAWVCISCSWQKLAQAITWHLLDPPGDPPWYKFTNYLNTKNRPFFNPSSWTFPVAWRSLERN